MGKLLSKCLALLISIVLVLTFSSACLVNADSGDYTGGEVDPDFEGPITPPHVHNAVWASDSETHWQVCNECQALLSEAESHTFEYVVTKAPSVKEDGLEEETCTVCGYKTGQAHVLPKINADHIPGDINDDGDVDNKDLIRLFQYLSEWGVEVNEAALDVNGDQAVDNKDLIRLFQYLSEWGVEIL